MEISLNKATDGIQATTLFSGLGQPNGGINGLYRRTDLSVEHPAPDVSGDEVTMVKIYETVNYQNRLWTCYDKLNKQSVKIDQANLLLGYGEGMTILRYAQTNNAFNAWFNRLNNVVVRYLPYATAYFRNSILSQYYLDMDNATGTTTLLEFVRRALTIEANRYVAPAVPNFLALADPQCLIDVQQLDVPIYYYRIGMQEIINSAGGQVPIPATITIYNNAIPPQPIPYNVAIGRATFLPDTPTTDIVDVQQVQVLGRCSLCSTVYAAAELHQSCIYGNSRPATRNSL